MVITKDEGILIIDSGCDQSIINLNSFLVQTYTGIDFIVGDALQGMRSSLLELVNDAYTLPLLPTGENVLIKLFVILTRCNLRHSFNHINSVLTELLWMIVPKDINVRMETLEDNV